LFAVIVTVGTTHGGCREPIVVTFDHALELAARPHKGGETEKLVTPVKLLKKQD